MRSASGVMFSKRFVEGLQFGDEPAVLFAVVGLHKRMADQPDLQQAPHRLGAQAVGQAFR